MSWRQVPSPNAFLRQTHTFFQREELRAGLVLSFASFAEREGEGAQGSLNLLERDGEVVGAAVRSSRGALALTDLTEHGTRFEFECYDVGHLYNLAHFADRGMIKPPFFVQSIFGILGGIGPEPENLMHMKSTADRLFGDDYYLSILAAGRHQFPFVTMGAILGGNVRVGLEDNLYLSRGELAPDNASLVTKIKHILEQLSLRTATPDEARQMLGTKGADNIGF